MPTVKRILLAITGFADALKLYRGVPKDHPAYNLALKGIAAPADRSKVLGKVKPFNVTGVTGHTPSLQALNGCRISAILCC
jgi:hypothetical protein